MADTGLHDITDLMEHYRIVARSMWNSGFWSVPELRNWDSRDQFDQIKALLFKALVGARTSEGHLCDLANVPERIYRVIPSGSSPVPIMIHRPRDGDLNKYWDDPVSEIKASDAELHFLDYFDWNGMSYVDFQYYRVRIMVFRTHPDLVGREALIERQYARVFIAGAGADR